MNLSSHNSLSCFWYRFPFNIKTSISLSNSCWCLCVCCEYIVIWSIFGIVPTFAKSFSQFLSSVASINVTMYFISCCVNNVCCSAISFFFFCAWQSQIFQEIFFCPKIGKMDSKWPKTCFLNLLENLVVNFSEFGLYRNFIIFAVFLQKTFTWEKSGSGDMGQNALD